jgi:predicted DNA-binding transcriptional regulator YafY
MYLFESIERIKRIHDLIKREATGTPDEFAERLHLKKRQLQNILEELRDWGADIRYNRFRCTYYYANGFEVILTIGPKPLTTSNDSRA